MPILVSITLLGWIPFAVLLFAFLNPQRAIIWSLLFGTLFLPTTAFPDIPFIPWSKSSVVPLGVLLGAFLFAPGPILSLRLRLIDLPVLGYCIWPMGQVFNGVDIHDCCSVTVQGILMFGFPYLLGRAYLSDVRSARDWAAGIFVGGIAYIPFCVAEMKLGPELHRMVYGQYAMADYLQSIRGNGYRPVVFMRHGLMLGMFMSSATLCGWWLWLQDAIPRKVRFMPTWFFVLSLGATSLSLRSTGAIILLLAGFLALLLVRYFRSRAVIYIMVAIPIVYFCARIVAQWDGQSLVAFVDSTLGIDRAGSVAVRFANERLLINKALQKPISGWGPNGANNIYDSQGRIIVIPDGFWVILLGSGGIVALVLFYAMLLAPMIGLLGRVSRFQLADPQAAAPLVLALIAVLFSIDCLANAMINTVYFVSIGSVAGMIASRPAQTSQPDTADIIGMDRLGQLSDMAHEPQPSITSEERPGRML